MRRKEPGVKQFFPVDDQGMARVVATLKAHNNICLAGEEVDDLAFTFIAPLGPDDCDVGHNCILDFRLAILDWNRKSKI